MQNEYCEVAERLNQCVKDRRLDISDIAQSIGYSESYIRGMLNGSRNPVNYKVLVYFGGLGCNLNWLLLGHDVEKINDKRTVLNMAESLVELIRSV
jgi:hypothetical protein